MRFETLRLTGFKSFVDPTELTLGGGLTGIVGPNGCGKSNVVEALRWVMGETSAKRVRGSEMDDVIFAGTGSRPPRNIAEVTLVIDNRQRLAPPPFTEDETLEVTRRIERGGGSDYRINGKSVRAKDVQILFADVASGAHSASLVSQGRISALLNAKPSERRVILEDAAGVAGLHARRHEAELRLRAAETNLTRLEDNLIAMDDQLKRLSKQARQAAKYKVIQEDLRAIDAALAWHAWQNLESAVREARDRYDAAEAVVREAMASAAAAQTRQTEAAAALPDCRDAERQAATAMQHLQARRERIALDRERLSQDINTVIGRLRQTEADRELESDRLVEARAALERIDADFDQLGNDSADVAALDALGPEIDRAQAALSAAEEDISAITAALAQAEGERRQRREQIDALSAKARQVENDLAALRDDRRMVQDEIDRLGDGDALQAALTEADDALATQGAKRDQRGLEHSAAREAAFNAGTAAQQADIALDRLQAEATALQAVLASGSDGEGGIVDDVAADPGFEAALAVALDDDLLIGVDPAADRYWRDLGPLTGPHDLPVAARPLADAVKAPPILARRLSQIGVVDAAEGAGMSAGLKPGQALVSKDGDLWRWDGMVVKAGAPSAAAIRLTQRNKLAALTPRIAEAETSRAQAHAARDAARRTEAEAKQALEEAEKLHADAVRQRRDAEMALSAFEADSVSLKRRAADLDQQIGALTETLKAVRSEAETAQRTLDALPDQAETRARLDALQHQQQTRRQALEEKRAEAARLTAAAEFRAQRKAALERDREDWRRRVSAIEGRLTELAQRAEALDSEHELLQQKPTALDNALQDILSQLTEAETAHRARADQLYHAEKVLAEADRALRGAEAELAAHKEARAQAESAVAVALQRRRDLADRIESELGMDPAGLEQAAGAVRQNGELPPVEALETKQARLTAQRDAIGPVNLRAETEAESLAAEIEGLKQERDELIAAIEKLRQAIAKLNREARQRVQAAFEQVDAHFQRLFARLFHGGSAHLELTEADDPLKSGLEIYASPPGKKLQHLSLLSGGEQALTAIALLFAMFLTNPSPICVLDEVDAPLDDANVDRFCALLEDMVAEQPTRFIVITHHRMTMARMNALFGVTMAEKGISQLVSVDLSGEPVRKNRDAA